MSYIPATIQISLPLEPALRAQGKQPLNLGTQHFLSARQPREQGGPPRDTSVHASMQTKINKILTVLKDTTSYDWKVRVQWMKEARDLIDLMTSQEENASGSVIRMAQSNSRPESLSARNNIASPSITNLEEFMRQLRYPLQAQILDQRSQVLKETCLLLAHLSRTLCQSTSKNRIQMVDKFLDYFVTKDGLLKVLHSGKTALHELAQICLKSVFTNLVQHLAQQILLAKILVILGDQMPSKNTQVRIYISDCFYSCFISQRNVLSQANEKNLNKIDYLIKNLISDASDVVRKNGQQSQKVFWQLFPKRVNTLNNTKAQPKCSQSANRAGYHYQGTTNYQSRAQSAYTTSGRSQRDYSTLTAATKREKNSPNASASPISARIYHTIQQQSISRGFGRPQTATSHQKSRSITLGPSSSGSVYGTISTVGSPSGTKTPTKLNEIKEVRLKMKKPTTSQIQQSMPSPLNYALKILKSRKNFVQNTINNSIATSQSKDRKNKTILSPQRQSPVRPNQVYSRIAPINTQKLQEKSMRVYESLRNPILSDRAEVTVISGIKSVEFNNNSSIVRNPINISIKIDTNQKNHDDESDVVKINNEDAISQGSSSHISRHSSPHSVSTNNKTLHQYLASMSPSPSRLKLKTQSSVTSTMVAGSSTSKKTTPASSNILTPRTPIVQTIDQALKDAQSLISTKRLHAYMNIQRYLQAENHSNFKMLAKDMQIMTRIIRQLSDGLTDQINQISKISSDNLKEIAYQSQYHKLAESMIHLILAQQMEILSQRGDQHEHNTDIQSLQQALIENFYPSTLTSSLLSVVDINRFLADSSYMINIFEFISTIIQHIQQSEEQSQQQSQSATQIYDSLLLQTPLLDFIASSLILARPYQAETDEPVKTTLTNKQTLFRMSKTLLELLHCVSSQSAFTNAVQTQLSHKRLSQMIQVIELTDPDDIDPELFGLLHSVSLEAEPTPSMTYHSTKIKTSVGINLCSERSPEFTQNLESPPASNRQPTIFTLGGKLNESVASINPSLIQGLQSNESQVRLAVVLKLASLRDRLGEEKFLKATQGKLTTTQQSLIKSLQERSKFKQVDL